MVQCIRVEFVAGPCQKFVQKFCLFTKVTPVLRHLILECFNFKCWQRRMSGGVHFVRQDPSLRGIAEMTGKTKLRPGDHRSNIVETFFAFLFGLQKPPFFFTRMLRLPVSRCTVTTFTTDSDSQSQIFLIEFFLNQSERLPVYSFHFMNWICRVTSEAPLVPMDVV